MNLHKPFTFVFPIILRIPSLSGRLYGGELARLGGLARLGEMIFISRSYRIFCPSSIKNFVKQIVWSSSFYSKIWRKAIMQSKCSYIIIAALEYECKLSVRGRNLTKSASYEPLLTMPSQSVFVLRDYG